MKGFYVVKTIIMLLITLILMSITLLRIKAKEE